MSPSSTTTAPASTIQNARGDAKPAAASGDVAAPAATTDTSAPRHPSHAVPGTRGRNAAPADRRGHRPAATWRRHPDRTATDTTAAEVARSSVAARGCRPRRPPAPLVLPRTLHAERQRPRRRLLVRIPPHGQLPRVEIRITAIAIRRAHHSKPDRALKHTRRGLQDERGCGQACVGHCARCIPSDALRGGLFHRRTVVGGAGSA